LVSFVDHNVGRLLEALAAAGLADNTRILYSADHGDNLGTRGLWGKSNMYEEAAGVPMILAGPDIPPGFVCCEPVSLVDVFPTATRRRGAIWLRSRAIAGWPRIARRSCGGLSIPMPPMRSPRPISVPASTPLAGARRSSRAAALAIRRFPAQSRSTIDHRLMP